MRLLVESTLFQALWFSAVLGQNLFLPVTLALSGLLFVCYWIHDRFVTKVLRFMVLGIVIDSTNTLTGMFYFETGFPLWLAFLWVGFSFYFVTLIRKTSRWPSIIIVPTFTFFGVISYWLGAQFDAVTFYDNTMLVLLVITIEWGLLCTLARRWFI